MTTRPEESLLKMVAALKDTTGRSLEEWREVIATEGLQKHSEVVAFLKARHGVSHGYANQIALRREVAADVADEPDPITDLFAKRPLAKTVYDALILKICTFGADIDIAPKKAYVSVRRNKQFAILQPGSARLDVGINLPGFKTTDRLEASGSFNAMLSHRVRVSAVDGIDDELLTWLRKAYDAS